MEQSNSMENLHFMMSTGNVRNLARLFEGNAVSRKPNFVLNKSKSKSYSSVIITQEVKETEEDGRLSFRDIHSKFESGTVKKSIQRMSSVNSLECLKLQEIKEVGRKTEEIVAKVKNSNKVGSTFYINHLNEIVEMLLKIGQIETDGNLTIQTEKLAILQVLQKCYSQLRGKLENFLVDDNNEEEEQKISIRSSIRKWESMIDQKNRYETPNYSTHFTSYKSEAKLQETQINGEIVKCTDVDDDNKMVGHVRVQNLKDIWERRGSEDSHNEDSHLHFRENEVSQAIVGGLSGIVKQFEESTVTESFVQHEEQLQQETQQIETQTEQHEETEIEFRAELKIEQEASESKEEYILVEDPTNQIEEIQNEIEPIQLEDGPKKTTEDDLKFLEEERKHTDDSYNETQLLDSNVVVQYLLEPVKPEDTDQNVEVTPNVATEEVEEEVEAQKDNNQETPLIQIEDEINTCFPTKDERNIPDGNVLSKSENPITSTLEFLDEERKNSDLQLEDIDPKFGPPTGIIPDPNQNYEQVQSAEENVADDQFVVILEKGDKENTNTIVQETTHKEENYLLIDNRSVEQIQQSTKQPEETVLVNGDKH